MNLSSIITRPIVVLSYGRSGSMLLTHNIGELLHADPVLLTVAKQMPDTPPIKTPIHTHINAPKLVFKNYTQIYNLRYDPVETILSDILANTFRHHHQFSSDDLINHNSFKFEKWTWLDKICQQFIKWHMYYGDQLTVDDYVVVYEKYVEVISHRPNAYKQLYTNKDSLLINYDQVREFIVTKYLDSMLASIEPFLQHQNPTNIYQVL
jgi:hypothetical protein